MKEQIEVKNSIYAGMSIYNIIKDWVISIDCHDLNKQDKKFLALYLGILNTENRISDTFKNNNYAVSIKVKHIILPTEKYLEIYNNYFVEIFNQINFDSIDDYFAYLLDKPIIKKVNKVNGIKSKKVLKESNKQLIKK